MVDKVFRFIVALGVVLKAVGCASLFVVAFVAAVCVAALACSAVLFAIGSLN